MYMRVLVICINSIYYSKAYLAECDRSNVNFSVFAPFINELSNHLTKKLIIKESVFAGTKAHLAA